MQWKSPIALGLFFLTLLGLVGCLGTSAPTAPPAPKYGRVRVACPEALGQAVVKTYGRNWERQTEGEIVLVNYDPQRDEPPDADVWVLPAATMPRYAVADKLRTLPDSIPTSTDYVWRTLLTLYREKLLVWDQQRYALPLLGESLLCCYRSDLFADPDNRAAFAARYQRKLEPPTTWEQLADIAEFFSLRGHPEKIAGLPPLPDDDDELEREFYTIAANYAGQAISGNADSDERALFSFQYDSATGEPRLATGGFVHALRLLKRLQACRAPAGKGRPADAFAEGRAVFCLVPTARLAEFQERSPVKDRFAVCRMPGAAGYYDFAAPQRWVAHDNNSVPYVGAAGWLGVVPKSATADEAAFSLLTFLSSPAVSKQIVIDPRVGGGPTRQEHLDPTAKGWETFGLNGGQTAKVKDALQQLLERPGLRNPALRLRTPDEAPHRLALDKELRAALQGDRKTPEQALRDAAAVWKQLDEKHGLGAHWAEYRISQGLLGRK